MINHRTYLCHQLYEISQLMDVLMVQIYSLENDLENPNHYVNVFNKDHEWHHKIDIKQRAYSRLLERFQTIKQQIQ